MKKPLSMVCEELMDAPQLWHSESERLRTERNKLIAFTKNTSIAHILFASPKPSWRPGGNKAKRVATRRAELNFS